MDTSLNKSSTRFHPLRVGIVGVFALGIFTYFVREFTRSRQLYVILLHLSLTGIIVSISLGMAFVCAQGLLLERSYNLAGLKRSPGYGILMFLSMNFINIAAPAAGFSGSAFLVIREGENGVSRPQAILLSLLFNITDYAVFVLILLGSLWYLTAVGHISNFVLIAAVIFSVAILALACLTVFLFSHPTALKLFLSKTQRLTHRWLKPDQALRFAEECTRSWRQVTNHPQAVFGSAAYALLNQVLGMLLLAYCLYAFGMHVTLARVIAGYVIGSLLYTVSITPAGIGFAEGGISAALVGFGVPLEGAILTSLLYRFSSVFIPLLCGGVAFQRLPRLATV